MRAFWEQDVYVVIERKGGEDSVVYAVRQEGKPSAKVRIVHRNLLLQCSEAFGKEPVRKTRSEDQESRKKEEYRNIRRKEKTSCIKKRKVTFSEENSLPETNDEN